MSVFQNRIIFGKEKSINKGAWSSCPVCDVERGQYHEYGCAAEECPWCHLALITCHCRSIEPEEARRHIVALEESFSSPEEVAAIIYQPVKYEIPSLLFVAAMKSVFDFAGIEPKGFDGLGDPLYSAEDVNSFGLLGLDCV